MAQRPLPTQTSGASTMVNFRLGDGDLDKLKRFAERRDMKRSDVIRKALLRYLAEEEAPRAS